MGLVRLTNKTDSNPFQEPRGKRKKTKSAFQALWSSSRQTHQTHQEPRRLIPRKNRKNHIGLLIRQSSERRNEEQTATR